MIYRIISLKTQSTQNSFTLKQFDVKVFWILKIFSFHFSSSQFSAILSGKTKFRSTDTSAESKTLFNPSTQFLVQFVALLLQMKLDHANEQIVQDVTLWSHF